MRKGWYGNRYGHSLASRGIKSKTSPFETENISNRDIKLQMLWFLGDCKYVSEEEMNDYDDEYSLCSVEVDKILYHYNTDNELEIVFEGTIAGVKDKYYFSGQYFAGSYEEPPDVDYEWMSLSQIIEQEESRLKYMKNLYKKDLKNKKLEIFKELSDE